MTTNLKTFIQPFYTQYKNFMRVNSYFQLTNRVVVDLSKVLTEYHNISQTYIQKLSALNSNYNNIIENYKNMLEFSGRQFIDLIELLQIFNTFFTTEISTLQSYMQGLEAVLKENSIKPETLKENEKINQLSVKYESQERKINPKISDFQNNYKNLFDNYCLTEDIIANYFVGQKENSEIVTQNIFNNAISNITKKETNFKKYSTDFIKERQDLYDLYDNFIQKAKNKASENTDLIKRNLNFLLPLYINYHEKTYLTIDKLIKDISEKKMVENLDKILSGIMEEGCKLTTIPKFLPRCLKNSENSKVIKKIIKIKNLNNNSIEYGDNLKLNDEEIYEIIKTMYEKFELIDTSKYDLNEEKSKIHLNDIISKLILFGLKIYNKNKVKDIEEITDDEIQELYNLMDKTSNILIFLQRLNDYRSTGVYEMPKKEFEITSKLFLIIADKINKEESIECIQLFLIVSQTFYYTNDENKKIYLQDIVAKHPMFQKYDMWLKYLTNFIENEIESSQQVSQMNGITVGGDLKSENMNNILFAVLVPFCDNMVDFCQDVEQLKKLLTEVFQKYDVDKEVQNNIMNILEEKVKK